MSVATFASLSKERVLEALRNGQSDLCPLDDEKAIDELFDTLSPCHIEYLLEAYRVRDRMPRLELIHRMLSRQEWSWRAMALQALRAFAYPSVPATILASLRQRRVSVEAELSLLQEIENKYGR